MSAYEKTIKHFVRNDVDKHYQGVNAMVLMVQP
jgi:hypothetical protein